MKLKQSETIEIERSKINFAAYNPRKDDPEVVKSIKANFKNVGYLGGIVWNETTGNLVSGHKRVQALDLINKYDGTNDYILKVEKTEMPLEVEMEQNIYMNNKNVQGVYDYKALSLMLPKIDVDKTGLNKLDLEKISVFKPSLNLLPEPKTIKEKKELTEDEKADNIQELKELKKDIKMKAYEEHDLVQNGHLTLVFDTWGVKVGFMEYLGLDINATMLKGEEVFEAIQKLEL